MKTILNKAHVALPTFILNINLYLYGKEFLHILSIDKEIFETLGYLHNAIWLYD